MIITFCKGLEIQPRWSILRVLLLKGACLFNSLVPDATSKCDLLVDNRQEWANGLFKYVWPSVTISKGLKSLNCCKRKYI